MEQKIITGKVVENPYGNWSDVDTGWYIGFDNFESIVQEFEGKNVKITIEIIPEIDTNKATQEEIEEIEWGLLFNTNNPDVQKRARELGLI